MFKNKYKIVTDTSLGYNVQIKYWFLPWWLELSYYNSHISIESAKRMIEDHKNGTNIVYSE